MLDEGTLLEFQADAESLMTDTCRVTEPDGQTFDQDTKQLVTTAGATVYEGKCRLRPTNVDRSVESGDTRVLLTHGVLSVPVAATGLKTGQQVEMLTSRNPILAGQKLTLRNPQPGSQLSAQRWGCEVVS